MYWNPSGESNDIPPQGISPPFDIDITLYIPNSSSIVNQNSHNPRQHNRTRTDATNPSASDPAVVGLDPDEIYKFLAQVRNNPSVPDTGGEPLATTSNGEPYNLSRYCTIKLSDEPLEHEAQLAMKAGRISEGENMLRRRQEEWGQGYRQKFLSLGSSVDVLGNTESCIGCEDNKMATTGQDSSTE